MNEKLFKDIFKEALQMAEFDHENVMKVKGVSLGENLTPEIILPLMDPGDLLSFLKDPKTDYFSYTTGQGWLSVVFVVVIVIPCYFFKKSWKNTKKKKRFYEC